MIVSGSSVENENADHFEPDKNGNEDDGLAISQPMPTEAPFNDHRLFVHINTTKVRWIINLPQFIRIGTYSKANTIQK